MSKLIGICHSAIDFDTNTEHLFGRIAANHNFLTAYLRYGTAPHLAAYIKNNGDGAYLAKLNKKLAPTKTIQLIQQGDISALQQLNVLFQSDPIISQLAWMRHYLTPNAYSLCGITHAIASQAVLEEFGNYLVAPLMPWDALVCTSHAVKKTLQTTLQQWSGYLAERLQARTTKLSLQLPVIPLGVMLTDYPTPEQRGQLRAELRQQWQIGMDDWVVLYVGRLSFYNKAHPIPTYQLLEKAAQQLKGPEKIHFIQAGWFETEQDRLAYEEAAKTFCPSVKILFIDGRATPLRHHIWSTADVFISLADNIQESFGLTPLEAMANQLPVIVADWDGYQDTVRDGIDGFRISTVMPPSGCGIDLALAYLSKAINYATYCGLSAMHTAIDIHNGAQRLIDLLSNPVLRKQMGAAGHQRIKDTYDWPIVIKQYETLWDELALIRQQTTLTTTIKRYPLLNDPFQAFAHFASQTLKPDTLLTIDNWDYYPYLAQSSMINFGREQRLTDAMLTEIQAFLLRNTQASVQQIVNHLTRLEKNLASGVIVRTLGFLIKFGLVKLIL